MFFSASRFILKERCSQWDQFVVILVVTLLLNVVFNNSTICSLKHKLGCIIVFAVALEAGGHFATEFFNISHSPSAVRGFSLVLRLLSDTGPTSFGSLSNHSLVTATWSHSWHTRFFSSFCFLKESSWFFSFLIHFILDFRKGNNTNEINQNINSITFSTPIFNKKQNEKPNKKLICK